eukprot:11171272-Lingulodinium_polyedra.AAC.1
MASCSPRAGLSAATAVETDAAPSSTLECSSRGASALPWPRAWSIRPTLKAARRGGMRPQARSWRRSRAAP